MTAVEVRDYQVGDVNEVAHVWRESWRSTGLAIPSAPPEEEFRERISIEIGQGWYVRVACVEGRIVGFSATKPEQSVLDQLFVSPSAKGTGVGSTLLILAKQQMPDGFWLRTDARNESARRFYEKRDLLLQSYETHPTRGHTVAIYVWLQQ
jgi:GNAT superfamily N-acetyltransferase